MSGYSRATVSQVLANGRQLRQELNRNLNNNINNNIKILLHSVIKMHHLMQAIKKLIKR